MRTKLLSTLVLFFLCVTANAYDVQVDGIYYNLNLSELTATVASPSTENATAYYKGKVVVPESFTYRGRTFTVNGIADRAFSYSDSLVSVTLPKTLKELPSDLFYQCPLLTNVDLPDSIKKIPDACFFGCKALEKVTIPDSVTDINDYAFCGCSSFGPEFTVRPNITYIGIEAFGSCPKLKRFIIEDTDNELKTWSMPLSDDIIDYMYVGRPWDTSTSADSIKVLELGAGLKTSAFPKNKYEKIISDIEDPTLFDPKFTNETYLNIPLYVPVGKVDAYRAADGWKNFFDIREKDATVNKIDKVSTAASRTATSYYNLSGQRVAKDHKGIVIERYSDGTSKKVLNK